MTRQLFCRWWCVNKNRNSQFCLKTKTIYPTQSYDGRQYGNYVCSKSDPLSHSSTSKAIYRSMGIFSFLTERDWSRNSSYGNSAKGVISFLLWCKVVVPSFKYTASKFPEISSIQYFPLFSCKLYDVITDLICIIEKCQYL